MGHLFKSRRHTAGATPALGQALASGRDESRGLGDAPWKDQVQLAADQRSRQVSPVSKPSATESRSVSCQTIEAEGRHTNRRSFLHREIIAQARGLPPYFDHVFGPQHLPADEIFEGYLVLVVLDQRLLVVFREQEWAILFNRQIIHRNRELFAQLRIHQVV